MRVEVLLLGRRKTHEEFIAEMAAKHPGITIEGTYIDSVTPLTVQCLECGNRWLARPAELS